MSQYKIVITDYYYPDINEEYNVFKRLGNNVEIVDCTKIAPGGIKEPEEIIKYVKDADALIVQFAKIDADVISSMQKCKVIARYAIGVDTIDLEAAAKKNIYVANVPDYCIDEVANTAIAHILNAMRKITESRDLLLKKAFTYDAVRPIKRLSECTLCLLGFGNIARDVARKMASFVKRIVVFDPYFIQKDAYDWVSFLQLDKALSLADVISIHVPLSSTTRGLLSKSEFARMKDGIVIVNTARGGIIDEDFLIKALESGKVAYAGLDVISSEDFAGSVLLNHPKVALTPHIGWCSEDAVKELQRKTAENVVSALLDGRPIYCVR